MKVVGGPCDGAEVNVRNDRRAVPLFHFANQQRVVEGLCSEFGRADLSDLSPVGPVYEQAIYTVRRLSFGPNDYYEFLAPADWTDRQAFLHQFGK